MNLRVSGALAVLVALSVSASACAGGGDDPKGAGSPAGAHASATPSPSRDGEPAYADDDAAFAAITDYNRRNNAVIPVSKKAPFPRDAFAPVDVGPTLAMDRWRIAVMEADPAARRDMRGWFYLPPLATYLPPSKTWPKLVLTAGYIRVNGKKPPKPSKWALLSVFVQDAEGAPLKHETSAWLLRRKLPQPLTDDADPAVPDRTRAVSLARALAKHWTKGTSSVPGFASTKILETDLANDRAKARPYSDASWTARLLGKPDSSVRTVPVQGGTLVVADFRITQRVWAVGTGSFVFWTGDYAKVLGGDRRKELRGTTYSSAVWLMPDGGGDAVPLGGTRQPAMF